MEMKYLAKATKLLKYFSTHSVLANEYGSELFNYIQILPKVSIKPSGTLNFELVKLNFSVNSQYRKDIQNLPGEISLLFDDLGAITLTTGNEGNNYVVTTNMDLIFMNNNIGLNPYKDSKEFPKGNNVMVEILGIDAENQLGHIEASYSISNPCESNNLVIAKAINTYKMLPQCLDIKNILGI